MLLKHDSCNIQYMLMRKIFLAVIGLLMLIISVLSYELTKTSSSFYWQVVAMMQVGNLPLPLPILTPGLHTEFPPVHIGIKVS